MTGLIVMDPTAQAVALTVLGCAALVAALTAAGRRRKGARDLEGARAEGMPKVEVDSRGLLKVAGVLLAGFAATAAAVALAFAGFMWDLTVALLFGRR